jgi:long-chain acyl-CoA synthetase
MQQSTQHMTSQPITQTAVADYLDLRSRTHARKEAMTFEGASYTYDQLRNQAASIARQLSQAGIVAGDRVAVMFPNHPHYVATFFAVLGMGALVVPINPLLKSDEISHVLSDSEATALVVHERVLPEALNSLQQSVAVKTVLVDGTTSGINLPNVKVLELDAGAGDKPVSHRWPVPVDNKDAALIVYTSGTTGKPKGAVLTHENLLSVFPGRLDLFDIDESDRCLAVLPLCHIYGMTVVMIGTVSRGGTLVIQNKFEVKATLQLIEQQAVTITPLVPAMYQFLLMELEQTPTNMQSVRICFSGAAPLPPDLISRIEEKFGAPLIEGYALTETACVATINPLHGKRKPMSVGFAIPGVNLEIMDDAGVIIQSSPDRVGEIAVKGPNIMLGYYKQPAATADVLKDGWFLTGDLGYKDEDGYVFIVGRKKEMIIRGGQNIYPREVEEVILRLTQVVEAAVIGVPDELMGERVKAFVVCKDKSITADDVKSHCAKHLADYKVPRLVEFLDALPRNSTGKVLKRLL